MSSSDGQGAGANQIAGVADDQCSVGWVSSDASTLLQVPGVAEQHHTGNSLLDGFGAVLDSSMIDRCTLAVATGDNDRVGALRSSLAEEVS